MKLAKLSFAFAMAFAMMIGSTVFGQDCSNSARTPLKSIIAAKPVRSAVCGVLGRITAKSQNSCSGVQTANCSSPVAASCSTAKVATAPAPVAPPVLNNCDCGCSMGNCNCVQSTNSVSVAQQKSQLQASQGRMRHVGGSMGNGRFEGVGYSSRSPQDAIQNCCYYGRKEAIDIGVAQGSNGWYATVIYK